MTDLRTHGSHLDGSHRDPELVNRKETTVLLLHEALARSRMHEAEQAARQHRLARSVTAGRRWSQLARFAVRRADRARSRLDARPASDLRRGV